MSSALSENVKGVSLSRPDFAHPVLQELIFPPRATGTYFPTPRYRNLYSQTALRELIFPPRATGTYFHTPHYRNLFSHPALQELIAYPALRELIYTVYNTGGELKPFTLIMRCAVQSCFGSSDTGVIICIYNSLQEVPGRTLAKFVVDKFCRRSSGVEIGSIYTE